jgi:hypothetical protein
MPARWRTGDCGNGHAICPEPRLFFVQITTKEKWAKGGTQPAGRLSEIHLTHVLRAEQLPAPPLIGSGTKMLRITSRGTATSASRIKT